MFGNIQDIRESVNFIRVMKNRNEKSCKTANPAKGKNSKRHLRERLIAITSICNSNDITELCIKKAYENYRLTKSQYKPPDVDGGYYDFCQE